MGATAPASIGTGTATGGSVVATTTGAVPVNAIVIVACFDDKTAGSITFSTADTGTNTYTNAQQCTQSGAKAALLYSLTTTAMAAASSVTTTMDGAAGSAAQALWTIGGISLSSPLDIAVQTGGSGTAPSVSTGALAQPFEIIIATIVVKAGSADSYTPSAGFTALATVTQGTNILRTEYQIVGATTAVTWAPTLGTSRTYGAVVCSFKIGASDFLSFMSA